MREIEQEKESVSEGERMILPSTFHKPHCGGKSSSQFGTIVIVLLATMRK